MKYGILAVTLMLILSGGLLAHSHVHDEGNVIFSDEFPVDEIGPKWDAGDAWELVAYGDGFVFRTEQDAALRLELPLDRENLVFQARIRVQLPQRGSRPSIRFEGEERNYQFSFAGPAHWSLQGLQFIAWNDYALFAEPEYAIPTGEWLDVEVRFQGEQMTVYFNDELLFQEDDTFVTEIVEIVFYNWQDVFEVASVKIYAP